MTKELVGELIKTVLVTEFAILLGFSLIRESIFNWRRPSWLSPRVDTHREWHRRAKERNLAKLGLASPSADHRHDYGLFKLEDIKKDVRKSHLADQRFWRSATLLGYVGGTLLRFPDVAIKKPIPWILATTYACWSHRTEIPWCKIGNLARDVWSDPRSLLSIAIPALTLVAIVYALFFRNQLGHAQAREEAQKSANAELLALEGSLIRLGIALGKHVDDLARHRHTILEEWVWEASGGRYIWGVDGVKHSAGYRSPSYWSRGVADMAETYESLVESANEMLEQCRSISKLGLVSVCRSSTKPVFNQCLDLTLFSWSYSSRGRVSDSSLVKGYKGRYDELLTEFGYTQKRVSDGDLESDIEAVVRTGLTSAASIPGIRDRIRGIAEYREALVDKSYELSWYLDAMIVGGLEDALNCRDVANYLNRRALHESNSMKVFRAIKSK